MLPAFGKPSYRLTVIYVLTVTTPDSMILRIRSSIFQLPMKDGVFSAYENMKAQLAKGSVLREIDQSTNLVI